MAPGRPRGRRRRRPGLLLGAAWRPGPAGRFRFARPTAARCRARRARTRPRASATPDTLDSPRARGLGAPAGEPGQAEHLCATPTLPLGRARPPGRVQGGSFLFPAPLPALFPPELSSPWGEWKSPVPVGAPTSPRTQETWD